MHPFAYLAPTTVKEAVDVLTEYGDKARPLAGGTDLLVKARANVWDLDAVVDVKNIPELNEINFDSDGLTIGASVACCHIYENEKICKLFDVIKEKSLYGRKYMGVDRSTFLISKKFEIKGFWTNVKVKGHVEEVIDTIKSIK